MPKLPSNRAEGSRSLADHTARDLIVPALAARESAGVVRELSRLLHQQGCIRDAATFAEATLVRESLVSTAVDCGLALPHARLADVPELHFALGRSLEPISWGTRSPIPVRLVFLIAVPANDPSQYLPLIAALAKFGKDKVCLDRLLAATVIAEMLVILRQIGLPSARLANPHFSPEK